MFSVRTNMLAWNADRQFGVRDKSAAKRTEKLSSGYRVNRAADDASGLAVSEKMRRQIRGLKQASYNAQDGISMVQTAEGAMNEVHAMLQRANELAVKAANGTLTDEDRELVDLEIQQLKSEIDTTSRHTVFNEIRLFPEDGLMPSQSQYSVWHYDLTYSLADGAVSVNHIDYSGPDTEGTVQSLADAGRAVGRAAVNATPGGGDLADRIATEFIPKAAEQIFNAFPSLKNNVGSDTIDIKITVTSLGGAGGMLAQAGWKLSGGAQRPHSLEIQFDSSDFTMADAEGTGSMAAALQSTIAHELMHSVMFYTMIDHFRNSSSDKFPEWFTEGTAQLAGGGFPTNWNNTLIGYARQLTSAEDSSQDAAIQSYLTRGGQYTVDSRPYGHGYLAAAYAGWLSGGKGPVTGENIARGMDRIFADLIGGKTFGDALKDNTGLTQAELKSHVNGGNADLVEFVRKLSYESLGGAGSVITSSLNVGAVGMIGGGGAVNPPTPGNTGSATGGVNKIGIQVGADSGQHIEIGLYRMDTAALELTDTNVRSIEASSDAINEIKKAIGYVSRVRSTYGAIQNRLEHTIANLNNVVENTTASESRIRDTDIAQEMVGYSIDQILLQAGQAMLTQANQQQNMLLSLLS